MIKKILLPVFILFSLASMAQQGTSSPYSYYGIGDVKFKGTAENRAMGGLTIFTDSIHLNFQNPAALAGMKFTSFSIGGTYLTTQLKTDSKKENARRTAMDYLAVGIPIGKFGASFGLIPYSSVGYNIQSVSTDVPQVAKRYSGTGGVNKSFVGLGYQVSPKLRIGADFSYDFGKIETSNLRIVEGVEYGTKEANVSDISGVTFNLGAMFTTKLNKKIELFSSLLYAPESKLKSTNSRNISTIQYAASGAEYTIEENVVDVENTTLIIPSKLSFGLGLGEKNKWMVGSEITFQESEKMTNRFVDINNIEFENATRFNIGGYYIPNFKSFTNYLSKVTYRGGIRFENTGMVVNQKSIKESAITFGFGLPVSGTFSNINIGFELGKKGTTAAGLVQENFTNITVGFTFNDKWFIKKLYY
jgi:long-subunit fatty acid transport protein